MKFSYNLSIETIKMNESDFLKVVLPFKDKVFRLAKRLLVSKDEAEDATQELLFKLWKNKDKLSGYRNTEAFAMTMTKNYCYDRLKSKQASNLKLIHSNYREKETSLDKKLESCHHLAVRKRSSIAVGWHVLWFSVVAVIMHATTSPLWGMIV